MKKIIVRAQLMTSVLVVVVTLSLCLSGLELAGYLWERSAAQGPQGWTLVASRRLDLERHGSEEHPYTLFRPNEHYLWEGIPVHINSRGFRTEEFAVSKPAGTYRILNVGDSVAFGWRVRQEDTYGKRLERRLNAYSEAQHYEVINAGIPGWSLAAARNFLLEEGLGYQPDLVVLDVTVVNDIYGHRSAASGRQSGAEGLIRMGFQWLRDSTYGWPFATIQVRFLLAKQVGPEAFPQLHPPRRAAAYYPLDEQSPVWDEVWTFIDEMHRACLQHGMRFIIVAFPTAFQLNTAAHPDIPQRVLATRSVMVGAEFLDLLPIYQQACADAAPGACEGYDNLLFADVWMHPNRLGHQLTAEALHTILRAK
jgi:hypothetical protein